LVLRAGSNCRVSAVSRAGSHVVPLVPPVVTSRPIYWHYHRCLHNSFSSSSGDFTRREWKDRLRDLRNNGTPEIVFGSVILILLAADRFLQAQQRDGRERMMRLMEREIRLDAAGGNDGRHEYRTEGEVLKSFDDREESPMLFRCLVRRTLRNFDGTKCLTNVKVGDVVEVLEEGVGPGNAYNLCRIRSENESGKDEKVSVGWFPMTCLEKLAD